VEPLTTPQAVAGGMSVGVPDTGTRDRDALDIAITDATAMVLAFLRRDSLAGFGDTATANVRAVTRRVAQRLWRNPQDWSSASANGESHSISDPRILTGDERDQLRLFRSRRNRPVILTPRT
jgi:hypothetical protein